MAVRVSRSLIRFAAVGLIVLGGSLIAAAGLPQPSDYTGVFGGEFITAPQDGSFAPDFTRSRLDGVPLTLSQQKGHAVLLNFWATWCGPCEAEMPLLQIIHEDYPDLVIWAMNMGEDAAQIAPWIEERKFTFPILRDPTRTLEYIYALRGQPSTIIIDRDGRIVTIIDGPIREDTLRSLLDDLFAKESKS